MVPLVSPTFAGTSPAVQLEREVNVLREEPENVRLKAEADNSEQQKRLGELQRRAASLYIPHAQSTPSFKFSQNARSAALPVALVTNRFKCYSWRYAGSKNDVISSCRHAFQKSKINSIDKLSY